MKEPPYHRKSVSSHVISSPLQEIQENARRDMRLWVQRFLGLFGWPRVSYDWSAMVFVTTINQLVIRNTCPLKQSQESLRRKLVHIHPLVVSGEGNSFGAT